MSEEVALCRALTRLGQLRVSSRSASQSTRWRSAASRYVALRLGFQCHHPCRSMHGFDVKLVADPGIGFGYTQTRLQILGMTSFPL